MKRLKIAIISKLWESTSPFSTGGTGMSVGTLVNGLVDRGHFITLFATADSKTQAQHLVASKSKAYHNDYSEIKDYQNILNGYSDWKKFDVISTHVEHKACFFAPLVNTPSLITLRYSEFFKDELDLLKAHKNLNYSFNSRALAKKFSFLKSRGVIHNGLDLNLYPFNNQPQNYLLFLSRISSQKGVISAMNLAEKSRQQLIIAGKLSGTDEKYLKKYFWPRINNKNIKYIGEVKFSKKIDLLKKAKALILPTQYFEACSNVILEAQACGTPVITTDSGSNSELIKNNTTGFISNSKNLLSKIKLIDQINRRQCRLWIESNFTQSKMVEGYEKIYYKLINKK